MRYVLLDRVVDMQRGVRLRARKVFPFTDEALRSDLSFRPVVPACLLIEAMAQAGGVLLSSETPEEPSGLVFAKIEQATFQGWAHAGEALDLSAEVLEPGVEASRLRATVAAGERQIGEMTFFLARRPLDPERDQVDGDAFMRAHHERGAVLGVRGFLGGEH